METNNKLREALKLCVDEMCARCRELAAVRGNPLPCLSGCEPVRKAKAALAKPPRNCDVGTAEEQLKRQHDTMCNTTKACPDSDWSCKKCFAEWAQMPYGKVADTGTVSPKCAIPLLGL